MVDIAGMWLERVSENPQGCINNKMNISVVVSIGKYITFRTLYLF